MHLFNKDLLISVLDTKVNNSEIKGYKVSDDFLHLMHKDGVYKLDRGVLSDNELIKVLRRKISGDMSAHFKKEIRNVKILRVVDGTK